MSDPTPSELARRIEHLEAKLNGRYVSGEVFNLVITELRADHKEHLGQHREDRGMVRQFRLMLAGAVIAATLSLGVSLVMVLLRGWG